MTYFRYKHAAETFAYQQKEWYGRKSEIIQLTKATPEGARWAVKDLEN
jgi:hypothetical protein